VVSALRLPESLRNLVKATLIKPVVGLDNTTRIAETIPAGAVVEVSEDSPAGWLEISWNGSGCSVFRDDLLDACSPAEASKIAAIPTNSGG
jgi:hypothetical protein